MNVFNRNKNLLVGTTVYFLPNHSASDPIMSGVVHSLVEYPGTLQYYLVEMVVPVIGDTVLLLRTNMNVFTNKRDVPSMENLRKVFKGVEQ